MQEPASSRTAFASGIHRSSATSDGHWLHCLVGPVAGRAWMAHALIFLTRLYAGVTITRAGISKLPTPDWMRDQVGQIGFPAPEFFAFVASVTEFGCGILLVLGLLARPSSLLLAVTMGVASFGYHRVTPFLEMHIAQGFFWLFILLFATGPGRFSLDALLVFMRKRLIDQSAHIALKKNSQMKLAWVIVFLLSSVPFAYGTYRELAMNVSPQTDALATLTFERVSIAGSFNQWSLTATPMSKEKDTDLWTAELNIESAGPVALKFAANGTWDLNLGGPEGAADLVLDKAAKGVPNGVNISIDIPKPGRYGVELNTKTLDYRIYQVN